MSIKVNKTAKKITIEVDLSKGPEESWNNIQEAKDALTNEVTQTVLQDAVNQGYNPGKLARNMNLPVGAMRRAFRNAGVWSGEERPRGGNTKLPADKKATKNASAKPRETKATKSKTKLSKKNTASGVKARAARSRSTSKKAA